MKTITCLALGVILLSFIVENSDGKITILHEGRVSGAPKRKSRRKTVTRRPSTPANEDSGNSTQDKRPLVVCNHTINVYLFLFQRLLSPWSRLFVISKRRPHDKKKKDLWICFPFTEIPQMARVPTLDLKQCSPHTQSGQDTVRDYSLFLVYTRCKS